MPKFSRARRLAGAHESGDQPQALTYRDLRELRHTPTAGSRGQWISRYGTNLEEAPVHDGHVLIYNIAGQAGTGKTWLMQEFAASARAIGAPVGWSDADDADPLAVMRQFAEDIEPHSAFEPYRQMDARYMELVAELYADPAAPPELADAIGRGAGRAALALARQVPGLSMPLSLIDDSAAVGAAGRAASYLATKLRSADDRSLVLDSVNRLSTLFVTALRLLGEGQRPLALFIDALPPRRGYLEEWLRIMFDGSFGDLPAALVLSVAGQSELSHADWSSHEPFIERIQLDVFSEGEAVSYLESRQIADGPLVSEILRRSGRLPILMATLAASRPRTVDEIGDPTATAIEVFLRGVPDQARRALVLQLACPRSFNQDIVAVAAGQSEEEEGFTWLTQVPFVYERRRAWQYHDVVRAQCLRFERKASPGEWQRIHRALARYYQLASPSRADQFQSDSWMVKRTEWLYHSICYLGEEILESVVLLVASLIGHPRVAALISAVVAAGEDAESNTIRRWGEILGEVAAQAQDPCDTRALTEVIDSGFCEGETLAWLFETRSAVHFGLGRPADALRDVNRALEVEPARVVALAMKGLLAYELHDADEGEAALASALELAEGGKARSSLLAARASRRLTEGQTEAALEDANAAVDEERWTYSLRTRARCFMASGDSDLAVNDLEEARELEPLDAISIGVLYTAYMASGREDAAVSTLMAGIRTDPHEPDMWAALLKLFTDEDPERAAERAAEVLEKELDASILIARARGWAALDRYSEAIADFGRARDQGSPLTAAELSNYGLWLSYEGQLDLSLEVYREALKLDPTSPVTIYNAAVARTRLKDDADAARARLRAKRILEREPDEALSMYGSAGLAALEHRTDDALRLLAAAVSKSRNAVTGWARNDIAWAEIREDPKFGEVLDQ